MASWVDFAAIKSSVPLLRVLEQYQIAGLRRSGRDQWRGHCPLHKGEGRDAFHVNTAQQLFHCFSCGAGGTVLDLVAALEQCDVREAAHKLAGSWGLPMNGSAPVAAAPPKATVTEKRRDVPTLGFRLRGVDSRHPYLCLRSVTEQTAVTFGLGVYSGPGLLSGRLVIPIHNEAGHLVAYCGRSLDGREPRYQFPPKFPKSQVLFNLHRAVDGGGPAVIVVEGFFDCLKVHQAGFRSVVALMGVALSERQQQLLTERFRRIILMLDGDKAGRAASRAIAARLAHSLPVHIAQLAANSQPDQLSELAIHEILTQQGGKPENT